MLMKRFKERGALMEENELIQLLLSDAEKGISALCDSYSALIYKIIRHRTGAFLAESDIEEAVSDVLYEIYLSRDRINTAKGTLASFVITVASRRAVDIFRKHKNEIFMTTVLDENMPCDESPDKIVLQKDERSRLIAAVKSLGEPDSVIVFRKYFLGEKYVEIGKALGLSENAVCKRHAKSLARLAEILKGDD